MSENNTTMLAGITFGLCRQSRSVSTAVIEQQHGMSSGTTKGTMFYFRNRVNGRDVDGLHTLKAFQGQWKKALEHYARYPFSTGMKILPAPLVQDFMTASKSFQDRKEQVWNQWATEEYPVWCESAPARMGALYSESDFPTLAHCQRRFRCDVIVMPLAPSDQWRRVAMISPDLAATMEATQNEAVQRAIRESHSALWREVMERIQHISDELSKEKPKIHESLLGNVISIVELIPAYNHIHNDQRLTDLAAQVKERLAGINVVDLRKDSEARATAIQQAQVIVNQFQPYARSFELDDDGE